MLCHYWVLPISRYIMIRWGYMWNYPLALFPPFLHGKDFLLHFPWLFDLKRRQKSMTVSAWASYSKTRKTQRAFVLKNQALCLWNQYHLINLRFYSWTQPKLDTLVTVWKFQDFYVIQILREINFGESRSSKTVIFSFQGLWILLIWSISAF